MLLDYFRFCIPWIGIAAPVQMFFVQLLSAQLLLGGSIAAQEKKT